ncbi:MAG: phospholipase D family protein [Terracidiphilus sp.]
MMLDLIAETESGKRQHRRKLQDLMKQTEGTVRIASAYVTDKHLLSHIKGRDVRLLTYISRMDIIAGASSLDSLTALIEAGVQCRYISKGPRLHAKVYLFDSQSAVVTSANLTRRALDENLEVGVHLSGVAAAQLIGWFDKLWDKADKMDLAIVAEWLKATEAERTQYSALRKTAEKQPPLPTGLATRLLDLLETGNRFFVCNTNRRNSDEDEGRMHDRGYATAWEPFNFPGHMERVEQGHAIFMFAKGLGIISIGRATGQCQILEPGNPDRVTQGESREWRVPTAWLAWKEGSDACSWKSPNSTFFDVSGDHYKQLRNDIKKHFLGS